MMTLEGQYRLTWIGLHQLEGGYDSCAQPHRCDALVKWLDGKGIKHKRRACTRQPVLTPVVARMVLSAWRDEGRTFMMDIAANVVEALPEVIYITCVVEDV